MYVSSALYPCLALQWFTPTHDFMYNVRIFYSMDYLFAGVPGYAARITVSRKSSSSLVYIFPHVDVVSFHPICRLTMPVGTHWYQHTTLLCRPFSWQPQPEKGGEGVQSRRMKRKQPSRTSCESTMSTSCAFPHSVFKYSSWEEF